MNCAESRFNTDVFMCAAFPEGHRFGDATLWCWIASEYPGLQLLFYYLFNTLIFLYNLSVYITVGVKIITVSPLARTTNCESRANWHLRLCVKHAP